MPATTVIFDMDGVLVDTEPFYFKSNNELFRELGFQVSAADYVHFVGSSATRMWTTLKERYGLPQPVPELIEMEYAAHTAKIAALPALPPIPGILLLLNRLLARAIPMGIASSSPRRVIDLTLEKSKLLAYFPVRVSGEEVTHGKPAPDIFFKAADLLGAGPAACLVIEDSPRGIAGARAAGMTTVGFQNPNSGAQDLSGSDLIVPDFSDECVERILRMLARGGTG